MEQRQILIVEDEGIVALNLAEILRNSGFGVAGWVTSGEEAIKQAQEKRPDLILMDIGLQRSMDGIAAAIHINNHFSVPIIFLTAHSDTSTLEKAKAATPYGYILKPYDLAQIRAAVELAIHKRNVERAGFNPHGQRSLVQQPSTPKVTNVKRSECGNRDHLAHLRQSATQFNFLSSIKPFERLPEPTRRKLAEQSHFEVVPSGTYLACEGDETAPSFIVVSGRAMMLKTSPNGKQLIVEILLPGDLLSLFFALDRFPLPVSVRVDCSTKILKMTKPVLASVLQEFPELYGEMAECIAARLRIAHDKSRSLAHDRAETRIAAMLMTLAPREKELDKGQAKKEFIKITRQELSDLTGTTLETAIRITKRMEREGLIGLRSPGRISILDFDRLGKLSASYA